MSAKGPFFVGYMYILTWQAIFHFSGTIPVLWLNTLKNYYILKLIDNSDMYFCNLLRDYNQLVIVWQSDRLGLHGCIQPDGCKIDTTIYYNQCICSVSEFSAPICTYEWHLLFMSIEKWSPSHKYQKEQNWIFNWHFDGSSHQLSQ